MIAIALSDAPKRCGKGFYDFMLRQGDVIERHPLPDSIRTVDAALAELRKRYPTAKFIYAPEVSKK